ncbi:ATP-binding protein [Candidatus Poribacteria bacterium]|nr:ATP-binding protein [Candidatus Poribacteria bacterium]
MINENIDHKREIFLSIPSEDKHIYLLDMVISYCGKEMGFDEETIDQINLAVIEAGTNAIKHGNKNDPEKSAEFRFYLSEDKLIVFIKDCGNGFDPSSVGDPLSPENFMKPCGRGIFLMKAMMDEVEYSMGKDCGTEVKMVKYKNGEEIGDLSR